MTQMKIQWNPEPSPWPWPQHNNAIFSKDNPAYDDIPSNQSLVAKGSVIHKVQQNVIYGLCKLQVWPWPWRQQNHLPQDTPAHDDASKYHSHRLTFMWWGCYGLCLWHKPTKLTHPFLFCSCVSISVFMALSTVFRFINSPYNSPFSDSVLLVLSLPYWSFEVYVSLWKSPSALI